MKRIIYTEKAPKPVGPYSQAVENNGILFISGQIAIHPETGKLIEGDIREQTDLIMRNTGAVLEVAGYTYHDVVKSTCLLADIADFKAMNEVYAEYYQSDPPARVAFAVKDLPLGALVEIETIAIK
jgi:2-iminobutanoate/2-iminopropanoate deaminase